MQVGIKFVLPTKELSRDCRIIKKETEWQYVRLIEMTQLLRLVKPWFVSQNPEQYYPDRMNFRRKNERQLCSLVYSVLEA